MSIPYQPGPPLPCNEIRALDQRAIEEAGIPGLILMENAGRGIAAEIYRSLLNPSAARVVVLCGAGNNGGDGFVVARHLHNAGVPVRIILAVPAEKLRGDAEVNHRIVRSMQLNMIEAAGEENLADVEKVLVDADVIVDALLGTGATGAPRGTIGRLVKVANRAVRPRRVAVDIPTGLDGDSGTPHEPCFRADATITMAAAKIGFTQPVAAPFVGHVIIVDIGVPREMIRRS